MTYSIVNHPGGYDIYKDGECLSAEEVVERLNFLEDSLGFEESDRKSFVEELEELEAKVIELAESIKEKPARKISIRAEPSNKSLTTLVERALDECYMYGGFKPSNQISESDTEVYAKFVAEKVTAAGWTKYK